MKFKSDSQRKAVFSNMFSRYNGFSLYYDEGSGRVRSTDYPSVDFALETNLGTGSSKTDINKALDILGSTPDEYYDGLNKVNVKLTKGKRGTSGMYYGSVDDIDRRRDYALDRYKYLKENYNFDEDKLNNSLRKTMNKLDRIEGGSDERPRITIRHMEYGSTPWVLAHEIGHHLDYEVEKPKDVKEPVAEAVAEIIYGSRSLRAFPKSQREIGKDRAEYAIALKEAKVDSYDDILKYIGEDEISAEEVNDEV